MNITNVFTYTGHRRLLWSVACSPEGIVATAGPEEMEIHLWQLETGRLVQKLLHRNDTAALEARFGRVGVVSLAFSADGRRLVSSGFSRNLRVWDVAAGKECANGAHFSFPNTRCSSVAFSRDAASVFASNGGNIVEIDATTLKAVRRFGDSDSRLAISHDGREILTDMQHSYGSNEPYKINLHRVLDETIINQYEGHNSEVKCLTISNDARLIAAGFGESGGNQIIVWDKGSAKILSSFTIHKRPVRCLQFTPDNRFLVTASDDSSIRIWDVTQQREAACLLGHSDSVSKLAMSKDGRKFVSVSNDSTARVFAVEEARPPTKARENGRAEEQPAEKTLQVQSRAEEQRCLDVQSKRRSAGLCVMCGKSFGFFRKLMGKDRHSSCTTFRD